MESKADIEAPQSPSQPHKTRPHKVARLHPKRCPIIVIAIAFAYQFTMSFTYTININPSSPQLKGMIAKCPIFMLINIVDLAIGYLAMAIGVYDKARDGVEDHRTLRSERFLWTSSQVSTLFFIMLMHVLQGVFGKRE